MNCVNERQYLRVGQATVQLEVCTQFISSTQRVLYKTSQEKLSEINFLRTGQALVNNGFVGPLAAGAGALHDVARTHQPVIRRATTVQSLPLPTTCAQIQYVLVSGVACALF